MALWPKANVLLFDPDCGLTDANRWRECSGNGLHAVPGAAYAAPAYGIATGPSGAKYILASGGANANAVLSTDFYAKAPTTALTVCIVQKFTAPTTFNQVFSCVNPGATRGFAVDLAAPGDVFRIRSYNAVGALMTGYLAASGQLSGRTRVVVFTLSTSTAVSSTAWIDGQGVPTTVAGGSSTIAYDAAVVPTLFSIVGGGNYNDGNCYWFGINSRVWTDQEARAFSRAALDRT